jgi:SAM-dependent methyltransferase
MDVAGSYDAAAEAYAEHLCDELDRKPLDRHLLNRFAEEVAPKGAPPLVAPKGALPLVADLGCGPGHVAAYLAERGVRVVGIDLSPRMIAVASGRWPALDFRTGDMRRLDLADGSLAGAIAFYAIVHFEPGELEPVFREMRRVLARGGLALVAFHVSNEAGDAAVHVEDLFGARVSLDFRFHEPDRVASALAASRLRVIERVVREPYPDAEYPSRRCYLLARAD